MGDPLDLNVQLSRISLENGTSASTNGRSHTFGTAEKVLTEYLRPLHEKLITKNGLLMHYRPSQFQIDLPLLKSLFHLIWGPDVFTLPRAALERMHKDIGFKSGIDRREGQSDMRDLLTHFHIEAISAKLNQVVLGIAMADVSLVKTDLITLESLISDDRICRFTAAVQAYEFLNEVLKAFFEMLSEIGGKWTDMGGVPTYDRLSEDTKLVIKGLSCLYLKMFRVRSIERCDLLRSVQKADPTSIEWMIYLSETLRLKRRESKNVSKNNRPTQEESDLLELMMKMEPDNPYVRMSVIDSVIDAVREAYGRFRCGSILNFKGIEDAMKFLQEECRDLTMKYKKNAYILCTISDYFVRFVPFSYFDKDFSTRLLEMAYKLAPDNPKITHRYSILTRMNLLNRKESLEWLEKTVQLDMGFYNGNLDYFKTLLGFPEKFEEYPRRMQRRLDSEDGLSWKPIDIADFRFHIGLAHIAAGNKQAALKHWEMIIDSGVNEEMFTLSNLDLDCGVFAWNAGILGADKLRKWIQEEVKIMCGLETANDPKFNAKRKATLQRIFSLMLGTTRPLRSTPTSGPYAEHSKYAVDSKIIRLVMKIKN